MSKGLKPCPFCGTPIKAYLPEGLVLLNCECSKLIECDDYGIEWISKEVWNTRSAEDSLIKERDRLKKTCKRLIAQLETGIEIGLAEIDFADLAIAQTHEEWDDLVTISRKLVESVRAGEEVSP